MRYELLLLLCSISIGGMQKPSENTAKQEIPSLLKVKRKATDESTNQLFEYIREKLDEEDANMLIKNLSLAVNNSPSNYYDFVWLSNPSRDLKRIAPDILAIINSKRAYQKLKNDGYFVENLARELSRKYTDGNILRAIIPFAAFPASKKLVAEIMRLPDQDDLWCKELEHLQKWLDTSKEPRINDSFYEEGILLLISGLTPEHKLINEPDSCLKKLLFDAVRGNYTRIFDALIEKGINVNRQNAFGETVLLKAAFNGNPYMVHKLINAGAQVNTLAMDHRTALDYAQFSKSVHKNEVIKMLKDKGAQVGEEL